MTSDYIGMRGPGYYIKGTRVSLDSVVYDYLHGESPETIQQHFPSLTMEQVFGAVAYYLGHRAEIDAYLMAQKAKFEEARRS